MSFELTVAALAVLPPIGLALRGGAASWVLLGLCAAGAAWGIQAHPEPRTLAAAAWSLSGALYGLYLARREASGLAAARKAKETAHALRETAAAQLAQAKATGAQAGREQKETLAIYGMIKGLAESLTWEEMRPKLEAAVNQYLGVLEFSLFVAEPSEGGKETFRPLSVRGLSGSAGASWATLERRLQERGAGTHESKYFEAPERAVALPIQEGAEVLGYFYARAPEGADGQALLGKARTFAGEISFAFRRVRLFREMESLSRTDGLTGVHRRGAFDGRLQEEVIRARTFKTTFCLMLLDIDHFKSLNDRYGHPFGDQVLRRVGELLNASVYETDFVARYGGEEFTLIMPRAQPEGAVRKAEAIRAALSQERFSIALETVQVTVSIGIAHFPRDASTPEELVAQADRAMYQAKSRGRDRVVDASSLKSSAQ